MLWKYPESLTWKWVWKFCIDCWCLLKFKGWLLKNWFCRTLTNKFINFWVLEETPKPLIRPLDVVFWGCSTVERDPQIKREIKYGVHGHAKKYIYKFSPSFLSKILINNLLFDQLWIIIIESSRSREEDLLISWGS